MIIPRLVRLELAFEKVILTSNGQDANLKHITAVAIHPGSLSDSRALRVNTPLMVQYLSKIVI